MPKTKKEIDPAFIEPSLNEPEKHQAFLMFITGFGAAEIEQRTSVRADKVRQWAHREEWVKQRTQYEEFLREKNPIVEQPLVQNVIRAKKGERKKEFLEKAGQIAIEDVDYWLGIPPEMRMAAATNIAAANKMHRDNLGLNEDAEQGERSHISLTFLNSADKPGFVKLIEPEKVKEIEDAKENG